MKTTATLSGGGGQRVEIQQYITRFTYNYACLRNNIKPLYTKRPRNFHYRIALRVSIYILADEFNIPLNIICDTLLISLQSTINLYADAVKLSNTTKAYPLLINDYTQAILRHLPPHISISPNLSFSQQ